MEIPGRARAPLVAAGPIATGPCDLTVVLVAGAAAAATAIIREGGAGGVDVLNLAAVQGTQTPPIKLHLRDPYLQAITGAGASLNALL
jgi:hypothetical protein